MLPVVLVDMDGVVADIDTALLAHINSTFGDIPVIRPTAWSFEARYGLPHDALKPWFYQQGTFESLEVIAGAQEGVERLAEVADVWFCSTPKGSPYCSGEKQAWIWSHFPGYGRKLILTKDKTLVRGRLLIDDKPNISGVMQPEWKHVWYSPSNFTWVAVDELVEGLKNANRTLRESRCW